MNSETEALLDRIWAAGPETRALLESYRKAKAAITQLRIEAQLLRDDAAAQRRLVELLTNELDQRKNGDG